MTPPPPDWLALRASGRRDSWRDRLHGPRGRAPQVREAARLRLALLLDPALARLHDILRDKHHPQVLRASKEVLARLVITQRAITNPPLIHPNNATVSSRVVL